MKDTKDFSICVTNLEKNVRQLQEQPDPASFREAVAELLPEGPSCTAIQHLSAATGHHAEEAADALEEAMEARAPLEAATKTVVGHRLKRSGVRWTRNGICNRVNSIPANRWPPRLRKFKVTPLVFCASSPVHAIPEEINIATYACCGPFPPRHFPSRWNVGDKLI